VITHSFAFSANRRLKFCYKSILPCTAFPSTLVSILELSPPVTVLLLLRVGGRSRLNTRALHHNGLPQVQLGYLDVTVQEKLRSGWPGPFVKVESVVISHSFAFSASRRLKFSYKSLRTPVMHSIPHLSACWISPRHYPYFSYSASEDCHV
jgi:hypothetical protein